MPLGTFESAASAEALIPGNPAHIQAAIDHAAAGVDPARNITTAWHQMHIPGWTGTAAQQWKTFTPREARHVGKAADAFRTVTQALTDYQTAFTTARAEAAAAILDAQAAERLTTDAKADLYIAPRAITQITCRAGSITLGL